MKKRILKIIGIVLASVFGFVGAVVGVLALMGKFKAKDVYPDTLFFEQEEMVIVDNYNSDEFYSFKLIGTNSKETDYEVNKNTCYLEFVSNTGSNLITLYDSNKKPISKEYNRYKIQCNAPTYFKLVDNDSVLNKDGKIILRARSEGDRAISKTDLTIWIDRTVTSIGVSDGNNVPQLVNKVWEQEIMLGTDVEKEINYVANPQNSLNPISKPNSDKVVELYFQDPGNLTDYILVTSESVKTNENLKKIIKYDETTDKFSFLSQSSGVFDFKIAVFKTFEDKANFEANPENADLRNYERVQKMLVTDLRVLFVDSDINEIDMDTNGLNFKLFAENNYITLNGTKTSETPITSHNLGLKMYKEGVETNVRYDDAKFDKLELNIVDKTEEVSSIIVTNETGDEYNLSDLDEDDVEYQRSDVKVGENLYLISEINANGISYVISGGVGVCKDDGGEKELYGILNPGVYLDFYTNNVGSGYSLMSSSEVEENFNIVYEIGTESSNKTWRLVPKKIISNSDNVNLGVLVINREGGFSDYLFRASQVIVEEQELNYTKNFGEAGLDLTLSFEEDEIISSSYDFDNLITNVTGSYNNLVFASTEDKFISSKSITLGTGSDAKTYYILGRIDGGEFHNVIKFNVENTITKEPIKLHLLQLNKVYGQSIEEMLNNIAVDKVKAKFDNVLTINPKFELNRAGYTEATNSNSVYNNTERNTITIEEKAGYVGMLAKFKDFYYEEDKTDYSSVLQCSRNGSTVTNIVVTGIGYDGGLVLTYKVGSVENYNDLFEIRFGNLTLAKIKVNSSAPSSIIYKTTDDEGDFVAKTFNSDALAKQSTTDYIKLTISYDSGYICSANIYGSENATDDFLSSVGLIPAMIKSIVTSNLGFDIAKKKGKKCIGCPYCDQCTRTILGTVFEYRTSGNG